MRLVGWIPISDTFNGKTLPTITTLLVLIESMGYSLKEFTEVFGYFGLMVPPFSVQMVPLLEILQY